MAEEGDKAVTRASAKDPMTGLTTAFSALGLEFRSSLAALVSANKRNNDLQDQRFSDQKTAMDLLVEKTKREGREGGGSDGEDSVTAIVRRKETDPPILKEVDPIKWYTFRTCFIRIVQLNDWDEQTAVLKLSTSIRDDAARAIAHIPFETIETLEQALILVEQVYLNPAGIEFYKATFKNSQRMAQESLMQWHTRAREMFMRAYPKENKAESNDDLKDKFVLGIRDRTLSTHLKASERYDEMTFSELLTKAQRLHGSALIVQHAYGNASQSHKSTIWSMRMSPTVTRSRR